MDKYLKFRTSLVIIVIAAFAFAMHPLTPKDFYETFRTTLRDNAEARDAGEALIEQAQHAQKERPDKLPSTALLEVANTSNYELKNLTKLSHAYDNSEAISMVRKDASGSIRLGLDLNGGVEFVLELKPDFKAMEQQGVSRKETEERVKANFSHYRDLVMEALRKRLETQNIFECEITPFGATGLSLKAPLVSRDDRDKLQKLIQMSNSLSFRLVHPKSSELLARNEVPLGYEALAEYSQASPEKPLRYLVSQKIEMTGATIDNAFVSNSQYGQLTIALRFNPAGASKFSEVTNNNINRKLAIVLDGKLYCAPVINAPIDGGSAEITGKFSMEEAKTIADALTGGSFPVSINVQAVYETAPTLGLDNIRNGIWSGLAALILLAVFMVVYYHWAGVVAVCALAVNVVLILGAMAAFDATLTMPGIAGIILTLGMAVDANVLVFERMREENEAGKSLANVVDMGFKKAYSAVVDGNLTTLLVAFILMYFGSGAIKGFAVSLSIGIIASMFTALFMTHVMFDWMLKWQSNMKLTMMRFFSKPAFDFIRQARIAIPLSLAAIILSIGICCFKGKDMLSVDFTGGTLLSYQYDRNVPVDKLEKTLADSGIPGKVTYKSSPSRADNRKLEVLIRQAGGTQLAENISSLLDRSYPELKLSTGMTTVVGGMVGGEMTKNAVVAIVLAFFGMIVYVTLRYELNYALAGMLALIHDVIIALGIFVLMGRELSIPVVAGLLTVIGYSINDTIVIFDRIREELHLSNNRVFGQVVNESLNRTLSRTILTSLTTFLVVAVMFGFGGIAINDFMLVMMLGIVIGSYSSIYIASPLVVLYHNFKNPKTLKEN